MQSSHPSLEYSQLPKLDHHEQTPEFISQQRAGKQQERRERQVPDEEKLRTTLPGRHGESKLRYIKLMNVECDRCVDRLYSSGANVKVDNVRRGLLPPYENSSRICSYHLSSDRSILPRDHLLILAYKEKQSRKLKAFYSMRDGTESDSGKGQELDNSPLPRVATIDFKNRAKEGRRYRNKLQCACPAVFWPQHLLKKLRICMDENEVDSAHPLFSCIK